MYTIMESDLVNDSKLPVRFSANNTVTHHVIFESSTRTGQQVRRQRIEESWERVKHLGRGGFGSVWLERCSRVNSQPKTRAVKAIKKSSASSQGIDLKRELQTIAKFSHWKV
jgi:serine/threonine protein kinase